MFRNCPGSKLSSSNNTEKVCAFNYSETFNLSQTHDIVVPCLLAWETVEPL